MTSNLDHIHIFKTNIAAAHSDPIFCAVLNGHDAILQWTIDCEDIDCVLRIVSDQLCAQEIIRLITQQGYHCEELE